MMIIAKINRNLGTRASKYKVSIYTERQLINSPQTYHYATFYLGPILIRQINFNLGMDK